MYIPVLFLYMACAHGNKNSIVPTILVVKLKKETNALYTVRDSHYWCEKYAYFFFSS